MQSKAYLITLADPAQIPDLIKNGFLIGYAQARVAFVGRSNVGKSTLINSLMGEKVARVSATPGKTRAIHFFLWAKTNRIVVDLPGYGFAKVARKDQNEWSRLLDAYFKADDDIEAVFMLFDSRHGPTESDLEALQYFLAKSIPIQVIMTKTDQLKTQSERAKRKREAETALAPFGIEATELIWISQQDQKTIEYLRRKFK